MKIEINEPCEQWLRDIMDKAFSKVEFQGSGHEAEIYVYDGELMDINIRYWESLNTGLENMKVLITLCTRCTKRCLI